MSTSRSGVWGVPTLPQGKGSSSPVPTPISPYLTDCSVLVLRLYLDSRDWVCGRGRIGVGGRLSVCLWVQNPSDDPNEKKRVESDMGRVDSTSRNTGTWSSTTEGKRVGKGNGCGVGSSGDGGVTHCEGEKEFKLKIKFKSSCTRPNKVSI